MLVWCMLVLLLFGFCGYLGLQLDWFGFVVYIRWVARLGILIWWFVIWVLVLQWWFRFALFRCVTLFYLLGLVYLCGCVVLIFDFAFTIVLGCVGLVMLDLVFIMAWICFVGWLLMTCLWLFLGMWDFVFAIIVSGFA